MNQLYTELAYTVIAFLLIIGLLVMEIRRDKKILQKHRNDFEKAKGNHYKEGFPKQNTWK